MKIPRNELADGNIGLNGILKQMKETTENENVEKYSGQMEYK